MSSTVAQPLNKSHRSHRRSGGGGGSGPSGNPNNNTNTSNTNNPQKKFKHERSLRKRSKSFSTCAGKIKCMNNTKPVLPTKFLLGGNINDPLNLNSLQDEDINRAMNAVTPKSSPIPTPPRRRGQVEVIIPQNIHDPLNLIDCADEAEYEQQLLSSPMKKGRKKRVRKRRTTSGTLYTSDADVSTEAITPETVKDSAKIPEETTVVTSTNPTEQTTEPPNPITTPNTTSTNPTPTTTNTILSTLEDTPTTLKPTPSQDLKLDLPSPKKDPGGSGGGGGRNKRKSEDHKDTVKKIKYAMDKIVSPVIPQPGAWLKRSNSRVNWRDRPARNRNQNKDVDAVMPQFRVKDKQYQYGNYNRYYGYRNPQNELDHRLKCFSYYRDLFEGKEILDIGCNIGHITLSVARDFGAHSVVGIDIDKNLIGIARKNIKHYVSSSFSPRNDEDGGGSFHANLYKKSSEFYPISMPILYGPIDVPGFKDKCKGTGFPHNVTFVQGNYVLDDEALLATEQPQFDVILCLSITKWIHLNWGDAGIKQAFRRMYAQLRPGGKLILEPQNWTSYKSKKRLTEVIYKNYNSIELFPEKFTQYLLSSEVGFAKSEILGYPMHHNTNNSHHSQHNTSKGFQRTVQVYTKSTMFPSERVECPSSCHDSSSRVYIPVATPDSLLDNSARFKLVTDTKHVYIPDGRRPVISSDSREPLEVSPVTTNCYEYSPMDGNSGGAGSVTPSGFIEDIENVMPVDENTSDITIATVQSTVIDGSASDKSRDNT